ncbi:MAG: response regulator, partial [Candidatus Promineifilaceae bacterium]|nr:response regulator [Candidatus Promineifilaceae bacterium]
RQDRRQKLDVLTQTVVQLLNHEFRTPLTYVTAYYDMLADGLLREDAERLLEYLRGIQVGAGRLSKVIEDLLAVLALRTGEAQRRFDAHAEPIDDLSQRLSAWCRAEATRWEGVLFECNIPESLPPVFGVAADLLDALQRVVDNAVKFSRYGGERSARVTVSASVRNEQVQLRVEDNGIGFPAEVEADLFSLFYQHDRPRLEQQGAGAGLAIVQGIIHLHRGRVSASSVPGLGSSFSLYLPIFADQPKEAREKPADKTRATILLAEDEYYLLEGMRDLLEAFDSHYDLEILTALDGRQALDILRSRSVDLLVSDIMMPRMDGYELLAAVRRDPNLVHIPVIFLTARSSREDILRGRRSGVEEYITKPYDGEQLFGLIVSQLDRHFQKQRVIRQDFDDLKRSMLSLLMPDFLLPITAVADHSRQLAETLAQVRNDAELLTYLKGIQEGSNQVTRLVEDFILLVELRSGEAAGSFRQRASAQDPTHYFSELARRHGLASSGTTRSAIGSGLPEVLLEPRSFETAVGRLAVYLSTLAENRGWDQPEWGVSYDGRTVVLRMGYADGTIAADERRRIEQYLEASEPNSMPASEWNAALPVVKNVVELHGGEFTLVKSAEQQSGFVFEVKLPPLASAG